MKISAITGLKASAIKHPASGELISNRMLGVEVEVEGMRHLYELDDRQVLSLWETKEDGSLRNYGAEFVFLEPMAGENAVNAVDALHNYLRSVKHEFSHRTSVHVHVDIRDFTTKQLFNFTVLYLLFERTIFRWVGAKRDSNIFCIPFYKAENSLVHVPHLLGVDPYTTLNNFSESNRYAAFNLASVAKLGTVEFRHHYGTGDRERILEWLNIILSMAEFAKDEDLDFNRIFHGISEQGVDGYSKAVFGQQYATLLPHLDYNDVLEGVRLAQDLVNYDKLFLAHSLAVSFKDRVAATTDVWGAFVSKPAGKTAPKKRPAYTDMVPPVHLVDWNNPLIVDVNQ